METNKIKTLLIGYNAGSVDDPTCLTVGVKTWNEQKNEQDVAVINVFMGDEATELFKKLTTFNPNIS